MVDHSEVKQIETDKHKIKIERQMKKISESRVRYKSKYG